MGSDKNPLLQYLKQVHSESLLLKMDGKDLQPTGELTIYSKTEILKRYPTVYLHPSGLLIGAGVKSANSSLSISISTYHPENRHLEADFDTSVEEDTPEVVKTHLESLVEVATAMKLARNGVDTDLRRQLEAKRNGNFQKFYKS